MSDTAGDYRHCAMHCVEMAKAVENPTQRLILLEMAQAWMKLADKAETRSEVLMDRIFSRESQ
jgi:hypothetical protein